jgi:hypothetical protein
MVAYNKRITEMIDLSQVPTDILREELERRRLAAKVEREKAAYEKVCCKNCAYRVYNKSHFTNTMFEETWVCLKRPKEPPAKIPFGRVPDYNKSYYVCGRQYNGCKMFIHKNSEKGQKIVKRNQIMAFRAID